MQRMFCLLLFCVLGLAACGSSTDAISSPENSLPTSATSVREGANPAPGPAPSTDDPGLNLLVIANGTVRLKRRQWSDYFPITFGSELRRGDLIRVSDGGSAMVLCDGLTIWEVPTGAPAGLNNGCPPPPEAVLVRGESLVGNTRGGNDPLIPYIISPRKTMLLSATPTLRWNPVPEAASYSVRLRGGGIDWSATTDQSELGYPGEPSLSPAQTYALIVDAENGTSSRDEGVPGIGFTIVDDEEANRARDKIERIRELKLPEQAEAVAIAQFMIGSELLAEAQATLQAAVEAGMVSPIISKIRGSIFQQVDLNLLAAGEYESALGMLSDSGDAELEAEIKASLSEVYAVLGDSERARQALAEAITLFETLGDSQRAETLREALESIGG